MSNFKEECNIPDAKDKRIEKKKEKFALFILLGLNYLGISTLLSESPKVARLWYNKKFCERYGTAGKHMLDVVIEGSKKPPYRFKRTEILNAIDEYKERQSYAYNEMSFYSFSFEGTKGLITDTLIDAVIKASPVIQEIFTDLKKVYNKYPMWIKEKQTEPSKPSTEPSNKPPKKKKKTSTSKPNKSEITTPKTTIPEQTQASQLSQQTQTEITQIQTQTQETKEHKKSNIIHYILEGITIIGIAYILLSPTKK